MQDLRPLAVLVALDPGTWAAAVVDQLRRVPSAAVVATSTDVADLLVTAATGTADVAVVSPYLDGLDRDVLARLAALGLAVVGMAPALDEQGERRLRQLGVEHVHVAHQGAAALAGVLRSAAPGDAAVGFANPLAAAPVPVPVEQPEVEPGSGRVVAVWGPTGAPGRSTVAAGLAGELAGLGWPVLLVDADPYGGTLALSLGVPDEGSGLAAACRAANRGRLDVPALKELTTPVVPGLSLLSGLPTARRWPELLPHALEQVLGLARTIAAVTVVDCGFALEQDEELSYDTLAPRRNGATLAALAGADLHVVVGDARPVGLHRLLDGLAELDELGHEVPRSVLVNRVTPGQEQQVRRALRDVDVTCLPRDPEALDRAADRQELLLRAAEGSALQQALAAWARALVGAG